MAHTLQSERRSPEFFSAGMIFSLAGGSASTFISTTGLAGGALNSGDIFISHSESPLSSRSRVAEAGTWETCDRAV